MDCAYSVEPGGVDGIGYQLLSEGIDGIGLYWKQRGQRTLDWWYRHDFLLLIEID